MSDVTVRVPEDQDRKDLLTTKLAEYRKRLEWTEYEHPELKAIRHPLGAMKEAVLERLLERGEVSSYALSRELADHFGAGFDCDSFNQAFGVIADYVETGGELVESGTGLR